MSKIALIIPYFGKWPVYIDLYFDSLGRNPLVELFLFTDIPADRNFPPNVRHIPFSLSEFNELASRVINERIEVTRAYKLCDYRPAYGLIFQEFINQHPYWAFGDLDLIYGNIEKSLGSDWETFDVLSMRNEWTTGSFTVLRNTDAVNTLFLKSVSWKKFFQAEKYLGFDECGKKFGPLFESDEKFFQEDKFQSLTYLVKKAHQNNELKAQFLRRIKESIPAGDHVRYDRGVLTQRDGKQLLHYHYITEKKTCMFGFPDWNSIPETYYITRHGFFTSAEFHSWRRPFITSLRMIRGTFVWIHRLPTRIVRKLKKITGSPKKP